jgi:hypothetical protein
MALGWNPDPQTMTHLETGELPLPYPHDHAQLFLGKRDLFVIVFIIDRSQGLDRTITQWDKSSEWSLREYDTI